jgi:thioredoxin-dependent peroxiredoxin
VNQLLNLKIKQMNFKSTKIQVLIFSFLSLSTIMSIAQQTKMIESQPVPVFTAKNVDGKQINLSDFKGKKVLLTFYRNVGCPICNFRFNELQQQSEYFKSKGLVLLAVYESSTENMQKYINNKHFYAIMIPNSDLNLYQLYNVERNMGKVMKSMFHGAMGKMSEGNKLFDTKIKQDGNKDRIGADFLIDEKGNLLKAYYGKYVGDHLSISEINKMI